ncbi:uncharacterized protein LOC113157738 [Anabas testudineus]|uniref:uncharacterized protein LOC113157738 n=1 Tax=Anabas testudineus TaxID=64144 RepID=UPI000E463E11|nr:uncharacterized protein LOC113157738 [Anabas testudineus]
MTAWDAAGGVLVVITLWLLSFPTVGQSPFTVSGSQDVYQAEEHSNITLTWLFSVTADMSDSLIIDVVYVEPLRMVFHYNHKRETALYPEEFYRGRVQCDPELARKGQIDVVFTNVTLDDTGTYRCFVSVDRHSNYTTCGLNVTAVSRQPPQENSSPAGRERIFCYVVVGVLFITLVTIYVLQFGFVFCTDWNQSSSSDLFSE